MTRRQRIAMQLGMYSDNPVVQEAREHFLAMSEMSYGDEISAALAARESENQPVLSVLSVMLPLKRQPTKPTKP